MRYFVRSGKTSELTDPLGKVGGYINLTVPGADYNHALRIREILQEKIADLFEEFDVLAAASLPVAATPLTMDFQAGLAYADPLGAIGNLCGLPALSVPCGFTEKTAACRAAVRGRGPAMMWRCFRRCGATSELRSGIEGIQSWGEQRCGSRHESQRYIGQGERAGWKPALSDGRSTNHSPLQKRRVAPGSAHRNGMKVGANRRRKEEKILSCRPEGTARRG